MLGSGALKSGYGACSEGSHSRKTAAGVADPPDPGEAVVGAVGAWAATTAAGYARAAA